MLDVTAGPKRGLQSAILPSLQHSRSLRLESGNIREAWNRSPKLIVIGPLPYGSGVRNVPVNGAPCIGLVWRSASISAGPQRDTAAAGYWPDTVAA